jgi:hypothetical protein
MQMILISTNVAALAVAVIFYTWRGYFQIERKRRQLLRERVAFLLWAVADEEEMEEADALLAVE